jgi:hypothetical protein
MSVILFNKWLLAYSGFPFPLALTMCARAASTQPTASTVAPCRARGAARPGAPLQRGTSARAASKRLRAARVTRRRSSGSRLAQHDAYARCVVRVRVSAHSQPAAALPLLLCSWHMTFCSVIAFVTVRVLKVVKSVNMPRRDYLRRVMPIGALYAASLWLSNSAYLHLSVSFIQMTKALMPGLVYATVRRAAAHAVRRRARACARALCPTLSVHPLHSSCVRRACTWARSSSPTSPPPSWCSSPSAWYVARVAHHALRLAAWWHRLPQVAWL